MQHYRIEIIIILLTNNGKNRVIRIIVNWIHTNVIERRTISRTTWPFQKSHTILYGFHFWVCMQMTWLADWQLELGILTRWIAACTSCLVWLLCNSTDRSENVKFFKLYQTFVYGVLPSDYSMSIRSVDVLLEDSGNYTCEVRGRKSKILAKVDHHVFVRGNTKILKCL